MHLYSDKARCFNQSARALYRNFIIISNVTLIGVEMALKIPGVDLEPRLNSMRTFFSKCTAHAKIKFELILLGIKYHLFAIFSIKIYHLAQITILKKCSYINNNSATQLEGIQTDNYWTKA